MNQGFLHDSNVRIEKLKYDQKKKKQIEFEFERMRIYQCKYFTGKRFVSLNRKYKGNVNVINYQHKPYRVDFQPFH